MIKIYIAFLFIAALFSCSGQDFTVGVDKPLVIVSSSPSDGAMNISVKSPIAIKFSESVLFADDPGTPGAVNNPENFRVEEISETGEGTVVHGTITYDAAINTATFTPESNLFNETGAWNYGQTIRFTVRDVETITPPKGKLALNIIYTFRTENAPSLFVVEANPEGGNIPLKSSVNVKFNRAVDTNSVKLNETFIVQEVTNPDVPVNIEGDLSFNDEKTQVTFTPKGGEFAYSQLIMVKLTNGITAPINTKDSGRLETGFIFTFSTIDPPDFFVISSKPANGENNAAWDSDIEIKFSRTVDTASVSKGSSFRVLDVTDGEANPAEISGKESFPDQEKTIMIFTPDNPTGYSRKVRVVLTADVAGEKATKKGGHLVSDYSFVFKTENPLPLTVTGVSPAPDTTGIEQDAKIIITFSEGVDQKSVKKGENFSVKDAAAGTEIEGTFAWNDSDQPPAGTGTGKDNVLTFTPSNIFKFSQIVKVGLDITIKSDRATAVSGSLKDPFSFEFTVIDPPELLVIGASPSDNADSISPDSKVSALFSEELDVSAKDSFILERIDSISPPVSVKGSVSLGDGNKTLIFTPEFALAFDTLYRATLKKGIKSVDATDKSGFLKQDYLFQFSTEKSVKLVVIGTQPSGSSQGIDIHTDISALFNAAVDPTTLQGNFSLTDFDKNPVPGIIYYEPSDFKAAFAPAPEVLLYSAQYNVMLAKNIQSTDGGELEKDYDFVFDTVDPPKLAVLSTSPSKESENIKRDAKAVITLSEGVKQFSVVLGIPDETDPATLKNSDKATFTVRNLDTGKYINGKIDFNKTDAPDNAENIGADNILTFTPAIVDTYNNSVNMWDYSSLIEISVKDTVESDRATDGKMNPQAHHGGQFEGGFVYKFRAKNPEVLLVTETSPSDKAEGVERNSKIEIEFSEGVDQDSVKSGTSFIVRDADTLNQIPGTIAYTPSADNPPDTTLVGTDTLLTFTPDSTLKWSQQVEVILAADVKSDRATNLSGSLTSEYSFKFRAKDPDPLYVIVTNPGSGANQVARNSNIQVRFSEDIDFNSLTGNFLIEDATNNPGQNICPILSPLDSDSSGNPDGFTCDPASDMAYSANIKITLKGTDDGIKSLRATSRSGWLIPDSYSFSFNTADPPDLYVTKIIPGDVSTGVLLGTNITVYFSENINTSSVSGNLFVEDTTNAPGVNICPVGVLSFFDSNTDGGNDAVLCNPASDLKYSSVIKVTLTGGTSGIKSARATNKGGWLMPASIIYTFSAVDQPPLVILSAMPANFSTNVDPFLSGIAIIFDRKFDTATLEDYSNPGNPVVFGTAGQISKDFFLNKGDTADIASAIPGKYKDESTFVQGDTLVFIPDPAYLPLEYLAGYTYRLTTNICVDNDVKTTGGCLISAFDSTWTVAKAPPLEVVDYQPKGVGISVSTDTVRVMFSEPINETTLNDSSDNPGIYLNQGDTYDFKYKPAGNTLRLVNGSCGKPVCLDAADASGKTAVITIDPLDLPLINDTTYTIFISEFIEDKVQQTLPSFVLKNFHTQLAGLVGAYGPTGSGISIYSPVFIQFNKEMDVKTINSGTVVIWYLDRFGDLLMILGDISAKDNFTTKTGTCDIANPASDDCDYFEITPVLHRANCVSGQRPLPYESDFDYAAPVSEPRINVTLWGNIKALDDTLLGGDVSGGPVTFGFTTENAPEITGIASSGILSDSVLDDHDVLDGAAEVPVNSAFAITFSTGIDKNSLVASDPPNTATDTVLLKNITAQTLIPVTVTYDSAENKASITPKADLAFDSDFGLTITGRSDDNPSASVDPCAGNSESVLEVCTSSGKFLAGNKTAQFHTSPSTATVISPGTFENPGATSVIPVIFSREMYLKSMTEDAIYAMTYGPGFNNGNCTGLNPVKLTANIAINTDDPDSVIYVPIPTFTTTDCVKLFVNSSLLDYLGNPLPADALAIYSSIESAPAASSRTPETAVLSPATASIINGDPLFTLTWSGAGSKLRNRMLPSTFNNNSIILKDVNGCGGPAGGKIDVTTKFISGTPSSGDKVEITPVKYLVKNCPYSLMIDQNKLSNIYLLGAGITYNASYTVVNTSFNVSSIIVQTLTGPQDLISASPANVRADSKIAVTFTRNIDPSSISKTTLSLNDSIGGSVDYDYKMNAPNILVLTPKANLRAVDDSSGNVVHTISISKIKDAAGNFCSDMTKTFEVEQNAPTVAIINPTNGQNNVSVSETVKITFSEAMKFDSICGEHHEAKGITLQYNVPVDCDSSGKLIHNVCCEQISQTVFNLTPVGFRGYIAYPTPAMISSRTYTVTIKGTSSGGVRDLANNPLASNDVKTFNTMDFRPIALCSVPSDGVTNIDPASVIQVLFNEPVNMTGNMDSFTLFRIDTGSVVSETGTDFIFDGASGCPTAAPDGYRACFTHAGQGNMDSGAPYHMIVDWRVLDTDLNNLHFNYHSSFMTVVSP